MKSRKVVEVVFYKEEGGSEPVKRWLKKMPPENRRIIGEDIKTVEFGWPLGMPLVGNLSHGLWEVRSNLPNGIARVVFMVQKGVMILLHGFIKKSQKTPQKDMDIARIRASKFKR